MAISQTTGGQSGPVGLNNNLFNLADPTKYTSLYDLANVNAPDIRAKLTKTFGAQGISGFLQLTGAIKNNGTADTVQYYEEARLHQSQTATVAGSPSGVGAIVFDGVESTVASLDGDADGVDDDATQMIVRVNDVLLIGGVDRVVVVSVGTDTFTCRPLTTLTTSLTDNQVITMPIIGNIYGQGTDQPGNFLESNVVRRSNPYTIVKESYEVSGSQATNIGYIDIGGGDYRYYIKSEKDTRQRFLDKREMMMLLGQEVTNTANVADATFGGGTEGYFSALEARGMVSSDLIGTAGLADLDALIREMDKNGCPAEYAVYSNTRQDLLLDDMVAAAGSGSSVTTGVSASFGAFNNDRDMALNLGFKSFSRGGYTFHKNSFKLLNDPTLLGTDDVASNLAAGVMIPLANVVDPKSGERSPALEMNYKAAGGYNREMEHWVTGGGVLGFNNRQDGRDVATFNYRSECCLVTRAANQHVLLQGL